MPKRLAFRPGPRAASAALLLGIGIGLILASGLGVLTQRPPPPERVEAAARELGMVYPDELLPPPAPEVPPVRVVVIQRNATADEVSRAFYLAGLSESETALTERAAARGLSRRLRPGVYRFEGPASLDAIIDRLVAGPGP